MANGDGSNHRDWVVNADCQRLRLDSVEDETIYVITTDHDRFVSDLYEVMTEVQNLLIAKNKRYGNSALNPRRIFSHASPLEQINVRIDDKLSRMAIQAVDDDEDTEMDLIGYLLLRRIARRMTD